MLIALVLTTLSAAAQAETLHVDANSGCRPPGQGTEICPFHAIASATDVAQPGDEVLVAPGVYGHFNVPQGVSVTGEEGAVVDLSGASAPIRLYDGVVFRGLTVRGSDGITAVLLQGAVVISHCIFEDNDGGSSDGVIRTFQGAWNKQFLIEDTVFRRNTSNSAAIRASHVLLEVDSCIFEENVSARFGGAITFDHGTLRVYGSSFTNNRAEEGGGAIQLSLGTLEISGSTFTSNAAEYGGAIALYRTNVWKLSDNTFVDNSADSGGALHFTGASWTSPIEVITSDFVGNRALESGGAIYSLEQPVHLFQSVLDGNRALHGSGLYLSKASNSNGVSQLNNSLIVRGHGLGCAVFGTNESTIVAINSTFADNTGVGGWGRAVCMSNSYMLAVNSILWDQANEVTQQSGGTFEAIHSDIYQSSGVYPGNGNLNVDPQLSASYAPTLGSPIVDQGTNVIVPGAVDLHGNPRMIDGDGDGNAVVDLGAIERQ